MEVKLYYNTAEKIVVDKTGYITLLETLSGTPVPPMDLINPSILVQVPITSTTSYYNYCYITEMSRYYFINNKVWLGDDLWRLELTEDVLFTRKNAILDLTGFITRNEITFDPKINDPYTVIGDELSRTVLTTTLATGENWVAPKDYTSGARFIVGLICEKYSEIGGSEKSTKNGILYLTATPDTIRNLISSIRLVNTREDISNYIAYIKYAPYDLPHISNTALSSFVIRTQGGALSTGLPFDPVGISYEIDPFEVVSLHWKSGSIPQAPFGYEYLRCRPYRDLSVLFPPFGYITLDGQFEINNSYINLRLDIDPITGNSILYSTNDNGTKEYMIATGCVTTDSSFALSQNAFMAGLTQAPVNVLTATMSGAITGGGAGALAGFAFSSLNEVVKYANTPTSSTTMGGVSTTNLVADAPKFYVVNKNIKLPEPELHGLPLYESYILNQLSGFTIVGSVHVDNLGRGSVELEKTMVEQALKEGVIL